MHFANPAYFFLASLIAFIILLYFFRKQYKTVLNPSNLLWTQVMNEWQASPWLKKLQHNLIFWLQIAALLLLMLALVKPIWQSEGIAGEHLIFIVDSSATMSAVNEGETKFNFAKKDMLEISEKIENQEVTIITAGQRPEVVLNRESAKGPVKRAINSLGLTYEHDNIEEAVKLAVSMSGGKSTAIHIFSDSATKEDIQSFAGKQFIQVHNTGKAIENLALLSFGVARMDQSISAAAVVENQGKEERETIFRVKSEGEVLFEEKVAIKPGAQEIIDIPVLQEHRYYIAEVTADDGYQADNEAAAVLAPAEPPVFAIGDVNPFLLKGLRSIGIESYQLNNDYESMNEGILLFEGEVPDRLPNLPVLLVKKQKTKKITVTEQVKTYQSPLLEYTEFEKTYIQSTSEPFSEDLETVAESGGHPLIQSGFLKGQPAIAINFAIEDSDWPLQPGFPIFLYNSYHWLSQQSGFLGYFQPGEEKWLNMDAPEGKVEVFDVKGNNLGDFNPAKENFKAPFTPGIYQASAGNRIDYFSVILDDREKTPSHSESFVLNKGSIESQEKGIKENETFWLLSGILALAVLWIEWEVYRRGFGR
ncbi:VWA domain-containing protein [Neobacillus notoginsengisoli]|uniref:VWA domain-containing protein n=1 Tax=Neobacillus notoginsengisoli TaxID=1578198 RepID=A0A417YR05_9BACI|nr:BatA and WFA domain-containing protein [Neobacillus notoginsengisoli]RHW36433.1 VWA domain-containing protein [Neobacillus notoginsengisoli]